MSRTKNSVPAAAETAVVDYSEKSAAVVLTMPHLSKKQLATVAAFTIAFGAIGTFSSHVVMDLQDSKLSTAEAITLAFEVPAVYNVIKPMVSEWKNYKRFTESERSEVIDAFAATFDLPNDEAENAVETLARSASTIIVSVERIVKAIAVLQKKQVASLKVAARNLETAAAA